MAISAKDLIGLGVAPQVAKYLEDGIVFGDSAQATVAALAGTLTGSVDGTLADVAAVATAGGNTYADSAINTAITSVNLQLKELQTKVNAIITGLQTAGVFTS